MTVRRARRNPPRGAPECLGSTAPPRPRTCEHPACNDSGQYPAPRSREALRSWRWFCLAHVRDYNRRWNYFKGVSEIEIGREVRDDIVWQRPTWPLGHHACVSGAHLRDLFGLFREGNGSRARKNAGNAPADTGGPQVARALKVFGLRDGASLATIKARYKSLVKSLHPDTNGGDTGAADHLVRINAAYAVLTRHHGKA